MAYSEERKIGIIIWLICGRSIVIQPNVIIRIKYGVYKVSIVFTIISPIDVIVFILSGSTIIYYDRK